MRAVLFALAVLTACTPHDDVDRDAWRTVPALCAPEYDAQARLVGTYCAEPPPRCEPTRSRRCAR